MRGTDFLVIQKKLGKDHFFTKLIELLRLDPISYLKWKDKHHNIMYLSKYTIDTKIHNTCPKKIFDMYYKCFPEDLIGQAKYCSVFKCSNFEFMFILDYFKLRAFMWENQELMPNIQPLLFDIEFLKNLCFSIQNKTAIFDELSFNNNKFTIEKYYVANLDQDKTIEDILKNVRD